MDGQMGIIDDKVLWHVKRKRKGERRWVGRGAL